MNTTAMEEAYRQLREQRLVGELDEDEFKAEVERLRFEDDQGIQWKIGWYTGQWYRNDEGQWVQDIPQVQEAPPPVAADARVQDDPERTRRSVAAWLVPILIALLLLAAVVLVVGWGADWWGGAPEEKVAIAATATIAATPIDTKPPPTETPLPKKTLPPPTDTAEPTATRTPRPTKTKPVPTPSPEATATDPPTATPEDTPTVAPSPTSSGPAPTPKPALSGRIFFPVYDPNEDRRTFDIYVVDLESGKRTVAAGQGSQPALSSDGKRLAYHSWDQGQQGILVQEQTDGNTWVWVNFVEAARPSWSPDNQNIVFPSQQESDREWRVYRTRGLENDRVRRHGGDIVGRVPIWLSDGRIVYWECPLNKCGLYVMLGDGSNPVQLTTDEHDTAPAASPDGSRVAFTSTRDGNWEVYVVDTHVAPGQVEPGLKRLTKNGARDGIPTWSPDGKWLAFASDRDGAWAIWVMRPDGSGQRKLFDLGGPLEGEIARVAARDQHGWTWETIVWGP